jgi:hypothetical protein
MIHITEITRSSMNKLEQIDRQHLLPEFTNDEA